MTNISELRALIIDDSKSSLACAGKIFEHLGCQFVTLESDSETALKLITQSMDCGKPYDLVLTDINMPKVDGFQVLKFLAGMHFPGAVSVYSDLDKKILETAESLLLMYRLRVTGCIQKPIEEEAVKGV